MRLAAIVLALSTYAAAQAVTPPAVPLPSAEPGNAQPAPPSSPFVIPAGTKVPVILKHAISTKGSREGDGVYAQTTFPVVVNEHMLIPAGTYVQGRITHVQRAGHIKGRAEVLMHFTTLIYPNGYTVVMPGALQNAPGVDRTSVKDEEGTIRADSQTGDKLEKAAEKGAAGAGAGAVIGGITTGSGTAAGIGAGIGGAVGVALAMLRRGDDVRLDAGTSIEMVIQREVPLDGSRIVSAAAPTTLTSY